VPSDPAAPAAQTPAQLLTSVTMDRLESLAGQLSQITMYDIKSYYNQAKNVVLNVSEMEAKVREATNDDPWGASSTLMQEIATGTFNFQNFNEIMPCIYARFMEKEARQWREIYKALQLLEYLIKHGSERVVDDARSHVSTLKMLRNFHYIDDKGKDEGINVRNRARELVEMLSDVEKIRTERRKAKANRHKYTGTGNDGMSFGSGGGRYGGFGNESGFSGGSYSGGGGEGGGARGSSNYDRDYGGYSGNSGGFRDETSRRGGFEEYNAGDDETTVRRSTSIPRRTGSVNTTSPRRTSSAAAVSTPVPKPKEPEVDLLGGFGDDDAGSGGGVNIFATNKALPALTTPATTDDDDFADFQAAPTSAPAAPTKPSLMEMLNSTPSHTARPSASFTPAANSNLFGMLAPTAATTPMYTNQNQTSLFGAGMTATSPIRATPTKYPITRATTTPAVAAPPVAKPSSNFDDLWSMSLGSSVNKPTTGGGGGKSIKDLEKEKAQAGIWGSGQKGPGASGGAMDGFGNFGGSSFSGSSNTGGDDLLL
jgi:epsin